MNLISTGIDELDKILGGGVVFPHFIELISNNQTALIVALTIAKTNTSKTSALITTSGAIDLDAVNSVFGDQENNLIGSDKFQSYQDITKIVKEISTDIVILDNINIYPRYQASKLFADMTTVAMENNRLFIVVSPRTDWRSPPASHYAGQRIEFYESDDNNVVARTLKNVAAAAFKQSSFSFKERLCRGNP